MTQHYVRGQNQSSLVLPDGRNPYRGTCILLHEEKKIQNTKIQNKRIQNYTLSGFITPTLSIHKPLSVIRPIDTQNHSPASFSESSI